MAAPAKLISTSIGFQDAKGNVVANGMLMLTLSQTATVTATGGQVTIEPIYLNLDANGKITSTAIWFQDELSPSGTIYYGVVYASNKMRVIPGLDKLQYSITGASYDLATAVQSAAASPSYSGAVLLTPIADQTITQNNLLPGTDNSQSLGSAVKRWIGQFAALTALTLNKITFTQPASSATLTIANGKTLAANNSLTLAGTDGTTINLPASGNVVGTTDTQALSGKTLQGAGSGNAVTLLNEQGPASETNGTGSAVVVYTFSLPANTLAAGKGIRIRFWGNHSTGAGAITYQVTFGGTAYANNTDSGATGQAYFEAIIFNNSGATNAQHGSTQVFMPGSAYFTFTGLTSAVNTTSSVTINATFNCAAGTKLTPGQFIVELIQ